MTRPDLLAKWAEEVEVEDNIAAIVELTHAADSVIADNYSPMPHEALEVISHAIRHLTSLPLAVSRVLSRDARRNESRDGRPLYRAELRLELSRADEPPVENNAVPGVDGSCVHGRPLVRHCADCSPSAASEVK